MNLRDVEISKAYSTDKNEDLVNSFYNPVLECAREYDRVTGYFSPRVFAIAARGFRQCIKNNCRIRLITSVYVEDETYEAITEASRLSDVSDCVKNFTADTLHEELEYDYLQLFMYMYAKGMIELKIAMVRNGDGIFHEKIGVVTDQNGDSVSFSGSNNETAKGWIYNVEEFKAFKSWEEVQDEYCRIDKEKFGDYWNNVNAKFKILELDDAEAGGIIRRTLNKDISLEEIKERIRNKENHLFPTREKDKIPILRPYQIEAIKHWQSEGFISIFEMATGTGKTFTAISALKSFIREKNNLHCVIGVPSISLLTQWEKEIRMNFDDVLMIIVTSSSVDKDWRSEFSNLSARTMLGIDTNFVIITTYVTMAGNEFMSRLRQIKTKSLVLLADEMHNLITERNMNVLSENIFRYRLGLSATPVRLWAPDESRRVKRFFGSHPYVFPLERAIKEGFLVPYNYHVTRVFLTIEEFEEYLGLSAKIGRYENIGEKVREAKERILIARARIKKNAMNKAMVLEELIRKNKSISLIKWALFYVDNSEMLEIIQKILIENNIVSKKFTGEENPKDRQEILDALSRKDIDAIVAMKCLDEGVDIPPAKSAYFLSSNTDPREYIQRLGRVLRLDKKSGKTHANIYDFLVYPPSEFEFENVHDRKIARSLIRNETIRARFFCDLAQNGEETWEKITDMIGELGMTFTEEELNLNNREEDNGSAE